MVQLGSTFAIQQLEPSPISQFQPSPEPETFGITMDSKASALLTQSQDALNVFQSPPPQLIPYGYPVQPLTEDDVDIDNDPTTPPSASKSSKRRKLSNYPGIVEQDDDEGDEDTNGLHRNGSSRKSRPTGTKRACNQCRQQKLKCNVVESPWKPCDRCTKHKLECVITADFKRVGKRSQQAELERSNEILRQRLEDAHRELAAARDGNGSAVYEQHLRHQIDDRNLVDFANTPSAIDDGSHDAALLLNLKQSDPNRLTPLGRVTPIGNTQQLGSVVLTTEVKESLWAEYFARYHMFLPVLTPETDFPDHVLKRSKALFWTVILVAARHFPADQTLFSRLQGPYQELLKELITKPPSRDQHHAVKALCLLCTWPLPVTSSTDDMTFTLSGIMMKFAMHLGIHRPSSPSDFNNIPLNLRQEQITDRLRTWAICNLVSQNVSTGYGQPPETVWDTTLVPQAKTTTALNAVEARMQIEQLVDRVTKSVYCSGENIGSMNVGAMRDELKKLPLTADISKPLDHLYYCAAQVHLNLQVFFENHDNPRYELALQELHNTTRDFLQSAFQFDLQCAPNYILQMLTAAAVALLKLLNSFFGFADYVDRDSGVDMFWDTIKCLRNMSVRANDLPVRLAEVFAQMWNNWDTLHADHAPVPESIANGEVDASLTLKRRYRMSMSHVFDSIWRWKEELHGERDKLKEAVKNPTSPVAMTHRSSSFSNGRRPSSSLMDEANPDQPSMGGFGSFGGLQLAGDDTSGYASYNFFDPMGWYLNDAHVGLPDFAPAANMGGW